jgi:enamine deaminase RidA (YjgF/YER057c/UK114 family)
MAGKIEARLEELGILLPAPVAPLAADHAEGLPAPGSQLAEAIEAARICGVNLISQVKAATGDLDRVRRVVKLAGFVNCDGTFEQQPMVVNGASSLMGQVFGETGRHARSAVGCAGLPRGALVEVEGIFEIA